jgi:hypothetical protein
MVSRGRPPESAGEVAKDFGAYLLSPFVFMGALVLNIATGEWGRSGTIAETPFKETGRLVAAIKKGDGKKIITSAARTAGAWSGGKIPLQAIQTAEGAWDLSTGETKDWRELVWSKYSLQSKKRTDITSLITALDNAEDATLKYFSNARKKNKGSLFQKVKVK